MALEELSAEGRSYRMRPYGPLAVGLHADPEGAPGSWRVVRAQGDPVDLLVVTSDPALLAPDRHLRQRRQ